MPEDALMTVTESDGDGSPVDVTEIVVGRAAESLVVRLAGEIDAGMREAASDAMVAVVAESLPIVIDTSRVTFIDSSGLAFLMQLHRVAKDGGRSVTLQDPSRVVVDLLAVIGLERLFLDGRA